MDVRAVWRLLATLAVPASWAALGGCAGSSGCDGCAASRNVDAEGTAASAGAHDARASEALPTGDSSAPTGEDRDAAPGRRDASAPFGVRRETTSGLCRAVADGQDDHLVAPADLRASYVDGSDLLALVNRSPTGQVAPDWGPSDLVDLDTGKPVTAQDCDGRACLRAEAAHALGELLAAMKDAGFPGKVESAFRSYGAQCWTFLDWEKKGSFCGAVEQSALPGHSQHQLGTAVDLFTQEWADIAKDAGDARGVFRGGFGCTPGGKLLRERAPEFGFVLAYPIHPDDRHPKQSCVPRWDITTGINPKTGYRYEHWHLRYLGKENAARYEKAVEASGVGTPNEITLEQWLRAEKGIGGADAELPVCDGCNCGACATLAPYGESPCDERDAEGNALHLDPSGVPVAASGAPSIVEAGLETRRTGGGRGGQVERVTWLRVKVTVPRGVATQPPITGKEGASYADGGAFDALAPYPATAPRAFPPLAHAWVVGVTIDDAATLEAARDASTNGSRAAATSRSAWPIRAALTDTHLGVLYNKANVLLPAREGTRTIRVDLPPTTRAVQVTLLEGGEARGAPIRVELGRDAGP